jgi:hypothetical protein
MLSLITKEAQILQAVKRVINTIDLARACGLFDINHRSIVLNKTTQI